MSDRSLFASVQNPMSYNRPPSLILSPTSNELSSEPASDQIWRLSAVGRLDPSQLDPPLQGSPGDSGSTASSVSRRDDQGIHSLHSRGSSTTSTTSVDQKQELSSSSLQPGLHAPLSPDLIVGSISSERPHSFSGGISQSDLRRLQNLPTKGQPPSPISTLNRLEGPRSSPPRENFNEVWGEGKPVTTPPRYPSLGDQPTAFPSLQGGGVEFVHSPMLTKQDGFNPMEGFPVQQRQYMDPGINGNTRVLESLYRHSRGTVNAAYAPSTQPALLSATSPYMYPAQPRPPPLDRSQAAFSQQPYYDLMNSPPPLRRDAQIMAHRGTPVPASPMPVYATGPHTPAPDGTLRNPAMSMINGMPAMAQYMGMASNGLFTPPPNSTSPIGASFPGFASPNPQFYSPPSNFNGNDGLVNAMGRLAISPSFSATPSPYSDAASNSSSVQNQSGPSANNRKLGLYKTELCRSWEEKGTCRYGAKCQFAHSEGEVRRVSRHPKYKTEICRTFWVSGSCPYGKRCCFIHTELPASGTPPGADGSSPPKLNGGIPLDPSGPSTGNRDRSTSNASGTDVQPVSLLQRISAQQRENAAQGSMSPDPLSPGNYHFSKPGQLRLDTTMVPGKTNYPLTSNPTLASSEHQASPILPATAGPDFGRQTSARVDVVGYNSSTGSALTSTEPRSRDSSLRHSFNGTEMGISINSPVSSNALNASVGMSPVTPESANAQTPTGTTPAGHQRSGSAGQWPTGSLNSRSGASLASPSYIPSVAGTVSDRSSPWTPSELPGNRKRLSGTWL